MLDGSMNPFQAVEIRSRWWMFAFPIASLGNKDG
jgi:hypothetical protein